MSYAYKTGTTQSQQITTLAKLHAYSEPWNINATILTMLVKHNTNYLFNYGQVPTQHHWSVEKAYKSSRDNPRVGI